MKKFIIISFMFINLIAFSESGFETIINIPIGFSVGVPRNINNSKPSVGLFDIGILVQIGYLIDFKNYIGLSILGELGYSYDNYNYTLDSTYTTFNFHSLQVGIYPKFNYKNYSIGMGIGIKIPMTGYKNDKTKITDTQLNIIQNKIDIVYIMDIYNYINVIPYIKMTFDYSIFVKHNIAVNFGCYLGYDFGPINKSYDGLKSSVDSFDFGIQFGMRFVLSQLDINN